MPEIIPSYIQKVKRAEKHLIEFKAEFARYIETRPYEVTQRIEGKRKPRKVWRLKFTAFPENTDLPIIAADLIYNLRSALDHLAAALVPAKDRSKVMFPILWEGVWEPGVPGENEQRVKDRQRWITCTRNMAPEAVAIIKEIQPGPNDPPSPYLFNGPTIINRLSNIDRHKKFPLTIAAARNIVLRNTMADGTLQIGVLASSFQPGHALHHNADITSIPEGTVHVDPEATPVVVISVRDPDSNVEVPRGLEMCVEMVRDLMIARLIPYVKIDGAAARHATPA